MISSSSETWLLSPGDVKDLPFQTGTQMRNRPGIHQHVEAGDQLPAAPALPAWESSPPGSPPASRLRYTNVRSNRLKMTGTLV